MLAMGGLLRVDSCEIKSNSNINYFLMTNIFCITDYIFNLNYSFFNFLIFYFH